MVRRSPPPNGLTCLRSSTPTSILTWRFVRSTPVNSTTENYWCSTSSMYRIASEAGQNRERRRLATHPAKVKPELLADGPSQVWTWDITKLRGPTKGVWFHLYVLIDIYSRYNPSWIVSKHESAQLAEQFIAEAIERNGTTPHTVHADRGVSMTSGLVSGTAHQPRHRPVAFTASDLER